jgi:hypothetical protein
MLTKSMRLMVAGILLMIATESYAQYNPILMIGSVSPKSRYEVLPQEVRNKCKRVIERNATDPFTVFAHITSGNYEYYAEWGNSKRRGDDDEDGASILMIHGSECKESDLQRALMTVPPRNGYRGTTSDDRLPGDDSPTEAIPPAAHIPVFRSAKEESLLRAFVRDAIQRAIKAYNSETVFKAQACPPKLAAQFGDGGYTIVMQELKAYCSQVPK